MTTSTTGPQPIPTWYQGYCFRSRLEARWATFFDALGVRWLYEPQGYLIGPAHDRRAYLPDFQLPDMGVWVEVKGDRSTADKTLLCYAVHPTLGLPSVGVAELPQLLMLGDIPFAKIGSQVLHQAAVPIFRGQPGRCPLAESGFETYWPGTESAQIGVANVSVEFSGKRLTAWSPEWWCADFDEHGAVNLLDSSPSWWKFDSYIYPEAVFSSGVSPALAQAYLAARSARFEHGQSGAIGNPK